MRTLRKVKANENSTNFETNESLPTINIVSLKRKNVSKKNVNVESNEHAMCHSGCDNEMIAVENRGYPGYLTRQEYEAFQRFQSEIDSRSSDKDLCSTIFSFEKIAMEDPSHAICRWLRARKFNVSKTFEMIKEATELCANAKRHDFFPDGRVALGVEPSVYHTQYPQGYYGYAKGGFPLFISQVGKLNAGGMACITTLQGILNYHWHDMMHSYTAQLARIRRADPTFQRYEVVCIIDLDGLSTNHLTKHAFDIVKGQTEVDSLCFPETLHHLVIINAPGFFAMTWKLISNWIDKSTLNKITIMNNNRSKWIVKLRELVDIDQLPVDYSGTGISMSQFLDKLAMEQFISSHNNPATAASHRFNDVARNQLVSQKANYLTVRKSASIHVTVLPDESVEFSVFTRSSQGCKLRIQSLASGKTVSTVSIRHVGSNEEEHPTRLDLDVMFTNPGRYKFKFECEGSLFSIGTEDFLLITRVFGNLEDYCTKVAANDELGQIISSGSSVECFDDVSFCPEFCDDRSNASMFRNYIPTQTKQEERCQPQQNLHLTPIEDACGDVNKYPSRNNLSEEGRLWMCCSVFDILDILRGDANEIDKSHTSVTDKNQRRIESIRIS